MLYHKLGSLRVVSLHLKIFRVKWNTFCRIEPQPRMDEIDHNQEWMILILHNVNTHMYFITLTFVVLLKYASITTTKGFQFTAHLHTSKYTKLHICIQRKYLKFCQNTAVINVKKLCCVQFTATEQCVIYHAFFSLALSSKLTKCVTIKYIYDILLHISISSIHYMYSSI